MDVTIVDFSSRGMGIMVPESIAFDTAVAVECDGVVLFGEVVYSISSGNAYRVGLRLDQGHSTALAHVDVRTMALRLTEMFDDPGPQGQPSDN